MSDPWYNRLEICGLAPDVAAFVLAATPLTKKGRPSRRQDLSFEALHAHLCPGPGPEAVKLLERLRAFAGREVAGQFLE